MAYHSNNPKLDIRFLVQLLFVTLFGTIAVLFIFFTITHIEPHDFGVFYDSAKAALDGRMIYDTYGTFELPYWYFPWLAWFYIPFAYLPLGLAYALYTIISLLCAFSAINFLTKVFVPGAHILEQLFIFCMALILCWLLFAVGQMDFILLALTVLVINFIDKSKPHFAGLIVPILLFKPHLYILFLPFALFKGRKGFLTSSTIICLLLIAVSFLVIPDWPQQMLHLLAKSGQRTDNNWNFTTLPSMLGLQENWSGTANLPITFFLILIGFVVLWRYRTLDKFPFLSLALAGSLFCAPRAYSYNLPLLIPAMIWLTADLRKPFRLLFWLAAATIAFLFRFSSGTYSIVLAVFVMGTIKAHRALLDAHLYRQNAII